VTRQEIFEAIIKERKRQDELHPKWRGNDHGLAVLAEEFGEVARALYEYNEQKWFSDEVIETARLEELRERYLELQDELIQVAAVCVRWLENVD
jgi:NTP pyrophosphatase (non-canonical NTP hydrolase)